MFLCDECIKRPRFSGITPCEKCGHLGHSKGLLWCHMCAGRERVCQACSAPLQPKEAARIAPLLPKN